MLEYKTIPVKFVDAISQLDLLKMTEHDLLDAQDEFNRVCFKALNPTTGTYEADRIAKYWENQIGKKSSCLARQLLLGRDLILHHQNTKKRYF